MVKTVTWCNTSIQIPTPPAPQTSKQPKMAFAYSDEACLPRRRTSSTYLVVTPTDIVITHGSERETVISFHPTNSDGTLSNVCTDVLLQRDVVVEQKPSLCCLYLSGMAYQYSHVYRISRPKPD